ncbi:MAG: LamG domain-containing protein [Candidatus Methanoperedens sp.]|nr:LamG domain-containing protein [Candidatus Methanoperedens sp.]
MFVNRITVAITAFTFGVFIVLVFTETAFGEIARDGLVAEYHFEGNAYDSSGNGNTGSINNAIYVDGKFGKALNFNGINSSVKVSDSMSLNPVSEISIEVWVRVEGKTTKWSSILSKMEQVQDSGYDLYLLPGNIPRFGIISRIGGKTRLAGLTIPGDTWTHIAATYDGNILILYINGELDSLMEKPRFVFPSKDDLWIGCWKNVDHFSLKPTMKQLRVQILKYLHQLPIQRPLLYLSPG